MKIFIDTANLAQIREMLDYGVVDGVTTNPTLISREGRNMDEMLREIDKLLPPDGILFGEVISTEAEGMVKEAKELVKITKKLVVKIPMCMEGIKAVHMLKAIGIKTNVTLVFSAAQALLAAKAGASYVSPFVGRMEDIGLHGLDLIADIRGVFVAQNIKTEIICASIKQPDHVVQVAKMGADIATIPYPALVMCFNHPLSREGMEIFLSDWDKLQKSL